MNELSIKPLITNDSRADSVKSVNPSVSGDQATFKAWLKESLASVNKIQEQGDEAAYKLVTGQTKDIHGTMIAMQKASISMNLLMEVRNKVINAYEEIKRMQF